ncbi:hypothetical protein D3C80_1628320 [compost metagenome]
MDFCVDWLVRIDNDEHLVAKAEQCGATLVRPVGIAPIDVDICSTKGQERGMTQGAPVLIQATHKSHLAGSLAYHHALGQKSLRVCSKCALNVIGDTRLAYLMVISE